ncbi:MAG: DUF547 domain-containing protein [Cyanobacteriota bacterium]
MYSKHFHSVISLILLFTLISSFFITFAETYEPVNQDRFYSNYSKVLRKYVDNKGLVNYRGLINDRAYLDIFIYEASKIGTGDFSYFSYEDKLAFWINIYNALTIKTILDNYPVSSIKNISGALKKKTNIVLGQKISLEFIEKEILQKQFDEPKIHMAICCATMGGPGLLNEPYRGTYITTQLADQSRKFLKDPDKLQIDIMNSQINISPIFQWYGKEFIKNYSTDKKFIGIDKTQRAVMNFIDTYSDKDLKKYLYSKRYYIGYLDYNWELNETK